MRAGIPANECTVRLRFRRVSRKAVLESPRYFAATNPQLDDILKALDNPGVKVPREILFPLLAKLEPLAGKDSHGEWTYATALILYANNPDDTSAAARGLEILAGVDPHDTVFDAYDRRPQSILL